MATWEAILDIGAIPVFTEVDETLNMDPADLEKKITNRTRAIIPVHMLGAPARIKEIVAIADRHGIPVLEDTAQAAGGTVEGRRLGTFGKCGTFSFDAVKTMTTGEGGMIITDDQDLWRAMSEYHDHGHDHVVNPGGRGGEGRSFIGFNYRMMELQGAIGLAQLAKLDSMIAAQKKNKAALRKAISVLPGVGFRTLVDREGDTATFIGFFLPDADRARAVNKVLAENNSGAISFAENSWHYYPEWEHLRNGSTLCRNGWPFKDQDGRRRVIYDPDSLPASAGIIGRLLVYQVPIKLSEARLAEISEALQKAAVVR